MTKEMQAYLAAVKALIEKLPGNSAKYKYYSFDQPFSGAKKVMIWGYDNSPVKCSFNWDMLDRNDMAFDGIGSVPLPKIDWGDSLVTYEQVMGAQACTS